MSFLLGIGYLTAGFEDSTSVAETPYGPKTGVLSESGAGAPENDNSTEEERVF